MSGSKAGLCYIAKESGCTCCINELRRVGTCKELCKFLRAIGRNGEAVALSQTLLRRIDEDVGGISCVDFAVEVAVAVLPDPERPPALAAQCIALIGQGRGIVKKTTGADRLKECLRGIVGEADGEVISINGRIRIMVEVDLGPVTINERTGRSNEVINVKSARVLCEIIVRDPTLCGD